MMKNLFFTLMLCVCMATVAHATIARYECVGGGDPNTQTFARLRYDGSSIDLTGSWLMIGDHIHGANYYSDGITKFDIPDEIGPGYTINSAKIEGYFHVNNGEINNVWMALRTYAFDNDTLPIDWNDSPDNASMVSGNVAVFDFNGSEADYEFDITDDIAAKVAAGSCYVLICSVCQ